MPYINARVDALIEQYRKKGILLDSNLLLLLLVGRIAPALVGHDTLKSFKLDQCVYLEALVQAIPHLVTTPHVLAEVSNLTNKFPEYGKLAVWGGIASHLEVFEERSLSSHEVMKSKEFRFLGLTDAGLVTLASDYLIVSNDGRLVNHLWDTLKVEALKWVEVIL